MKELAINVLCMLALYALFHYGFEMSAVYLAAVHAFWMLRDWRPEDETERQIEQLEALADRLEIYAKRAKPQPKPTPSELRAQLVDCECNACSALRELDAMAGDPLQARYPECEASKEQR